MTMGVDEKIYQLARVLIGEMGATTDEIKDLAENFQTAFEDMANFVERRTAWTEKRAAIEARGKE